MQQSATSVITLKSNSSMTAGTPQPSSAPKSGPSSNNMPQRTSPTSRLTQTSLELSPDNQIKLVTTKQAGQRKANRRQTSKGSTKRKRQSPLAQAGGGKRTKRKGGGVDLMSPTIRDYFKTSSSATDSSKVANEPLKGKAYVAIKFYINNYYLINITVYMCT